MLKSPPLKKERERENSHGFLISTDGRFASGLGTQLRHWQDKRQEDPRGGLLTTVSMSITRTGICTHVYEHTWPALWEWAEASDLSLKLLFPSQPLPACSKIPNLRVYYGLN